MIRICAAQSLRQVTLLAHTRQFSTEIALGHQKTVEFEKTVDDLKKRIHKRTDFFPIESMTIQEEEKLTREGMKTVRTFNEMLKQAEEKAKSLNVKQ
jgi:hypothetical protein